MEVVVARRGIVVLRVRPGEPPGGAALSGCCSRLLLLWTFSVGFAVGLFMFASHVWASVAAAALLAAMCLYTCLCLNAAPEEELRRPPPLLRLAVMPPAAAAGRPQQAVNGGGLRQEDVDAAIPEFEYRKGSGGAAALAPSEQCAVCISVLRQGETVRRLPACWHAFHAPCIDGWLSAHATCPMCRADVKVSSAACDGGDGGGPPV